MSGELDVWRQLRGLDRRVEQVEVIERPGASGQTTFYATGTWTPTYLGDVTAGVTTYSVQVGAYTRIGNTVFFTGYVSWTAATGTGGAILSLPFTSANVANQRFAVALRINNVTFANAGVQGLILPNNAFMSLWTPASNVVTTQVAVEAAGDISYSGFFFV